MEKLEFFFGTSKDTILQIVAKGFILNSSFERNIQQLMELAVVRAGQLV